ncbi:MAG TPA: hypothetical protein VJ583_09545 [Nitrososphaeraceae archaeon]|nr:hypothetical protein [Nitrososphaeraceae archaeon]
MEQLGIPFNNKVPYRKQWEILKNQATYIVTKLLQMRNILMHIIKREDVIKTSSIEEELINIDTDIESLEQQFTDESEIIQIQTNEIQQTKDIILPAINQISPITAINGINESSLPEIAQVTQQLLLENFQEKERLQNIINTQQILINQQQQQLNQPINQNCQYQIEQWRHTAHFYAQLQIDLNCVNHS